MQYSIERFEGRGFIHYVLNFDNRFMTYVISEIRAGTRRKHKKIPSCSKEIEMNWFVYKRV